jgi:hypothetical protein
MSTGPTPRDTTRGACSEHRASAKRRKRYSQGVNTESLHRHGQYLARTDSMALIFPGRHVRGCNQAGEVAPVSRANWFAFARSR